MGPPWGPLGALPGPSEGFGKGPEVPRGGSRCSRIAPRGPQEGTEIGHAREASRDRSWGPLGA
eukprot:1205728-Pyramimonas_sp.AAC.1